MQVKFVDVQDRCGMLPGCAAFAWVCGARCAAGGFALAADLAARRLRRSGARLDAEALQRCWLMIVWHRGWPADGVLPGWFPVGDGKLACRAG